MNQKLQIEEILERLAHLEQRAADLYNHYAKLFRDDRDSCALFSRMEKEEKNHKAQVLLQLRVAQRTQPPINMITADLSGVDSVIRAIERQLEQRHMDILDALDFAIMLEKHGMEAAYRILLTRKHPHLSKLTTALASGDQYHVNGLKEFKDNIVRRGTIF